MEKGLDYVFDKNTKVIIMGTFPSIKSRDFCYYNNPQNQFWRIISKICNDEKVIQGSKEERYDCLYKNNIGLWDVIESCEFKEKSSLDSKIIKDSIIYNDFSLLLKECPNLECIVFNSKKAQKFFERYLKQINKYPILKDEFCINWIKNKVSKTVLPSPSSAYARMGLNDKIKKWEEFLTKYVKK